MRTFLPLLVLVVGTMTPSDCKPSSCEKRFELWTKDHSLCLPPSSKVIKGGIPKGRHRKMIVDMHNKGRSIVRPSASDMQKMYWDDELALMVKGYLSSCPGIVHDKGNQRYSPGKYRVGQNLASGTFRYGWWSVVKMWYSEGKDHVYGDRAKMIANFQKIGHYTQLVWANTSRVGCAWVRCKGQRKVYGCNYAVAGNLNKGYDKPYQKGTPCSKCPGRCSNKLCDCGGKACYNEGTLDLKTCTCRCKGFYNDDTYVAKESCAIDCDRSKDYKKVVTNSRLCQRVVKDMSKCKRNMFYALACPWLCGLCPHAGFATGKSPKKPPASKLKSQQKSSGRRQQSSGTATRNSGTGTAMGSRTSGTQNKQQNLPVSSKGGQPRAWKCPKMFTMWSKKHSMCLPRSNRLGSFGIPTGKDRKQIVDVHNKARSIVKPQAANMQKMYWDDELAKIALGWLASCPGMRHDKHSQRYIPGKYHVGQNIAAGGFQYGWWSVIKAWYDEVKDFRYGNKAFMASHKKATGHYTQVVWHDSARVGCAWVECKGQPKVYACNYGNAGNWKSQLDKPYKKGKACDDCPGRCKNGLCDCGGKVCYNQGTLDVKTCTCTCYGKTYNTRAYDPANSCALDCGKSVDYQKDSTKKWTCRRLAKKSQDGIKKACLRGFYSLACPWMCDMCPYVNGGSNKSINRKKPSKTPSTPKQKPTSQQKTSGGSSAQTTRGGAASGTSKQRTPSSPSKGGQPKPWKCPKVYAVWKKGHSMCLARSNKLKDFGIPTGKDRKQIVDVHNKARSIVKPQAANMQMMYWDADLAKIALGWLASCPGMRHDKHSQRYIPGKYSVGQNIAAGGFQYGWWSVIKAWYDEVKDFRYGNNAFMASHKKATGHYTQVVWHNSARVGCAWVKCKGQPKVYGCNYGPTGNWRKQLDKPYKNGTACEDCPGKCKNNLCDCGGKTCFNRGKLDVKTCTCRCYGFHNSDAYQPTTNCAVDCNKSKDYKRNASGSRMCTQYAGTTTLRKKYCRKGTFVALACPWLCGLCPTVDHRNH